MIEVLKITLMCEAAIIGAMLICLLLGVAFLSMIGVAKELGAKGDRG